MAALNVISTAPRAPVRVGLLTEPLDVLENVRLVGTKCKNCRETSLGTNAACLNCGRREVEVTPLSTNGALWTFTIVRHKPPGDYRGPEPFIPFGLGLVELAEGIRVMSPLAGDPESFKIGDTVRFKPVVYPGGGDKPDVVAFAFEKMDGAFL